MFPAVSLSLSGSVRRVNYFWRSFLPDCQSALVCKARRSLKHCVCYLCFATVIEKAGESFMEHYLWIAFPEIAANKHPKLQI